MIAKLLLLYGFCCNLTCQAWVSIPLSNMKKNTKRAFFFKQAAASIEEQSVTIHEGERNLIPEYEATFNYICTTMKEKLPDKYKQNESILSLLEHFAKEYVGACQDGFLSGATGTDISCQSEAVAKRFLLGIHLAATYGMGSTKYQFQPYHQMCLGKDPENEMGNTMDLYAVGNNFFGPCMNIDKSIVLGRENIDRIIEQLKQGHNVVMLANHQSEADPQVVSRLMEEMTPYGKEFQQLIFVAGHKVTTDPLAVPFSMGRNLICIHSKKHIDADPNTKAKKQKDNLRAMSALLKNFQKGGTMIWVAPSGGRDRRNVTTGEIPIAPFDSKTIDMFRLIGNKSNVTTHYYTMAMVSYNLCPPPDFVEAGVGEARNVRFVPVGIAVGNECQAIDKESDTRDDFCNLAFQQCNADYQTLLKQLDG